MERYSREPRELLGPEVEHYKTSLSQATWTGAGSIQDVSTCSPQDSPENHDEDGDAGADALECRPKQRILHTLTLSPLETTSCAKRLLVPRSPCAGTALHGGVARSLADNGGCLTLASVRAALEACNHRKIISHRNLCATVVSRMIPLMASPVLAFSVKALRCCGTASTEVRGQLRLSSANVIPAAASNVEEFHKLSNACALVPLQSALEWGWLS